MIDFESLFKFHTTLQGVSNKMASDMITIINSSDEEIIRIVKREITKIKKNFSRDSAGAFKSINSLIETVRAIRSESFVASESGIAVSLSAVSKRSSEHAEKQLSYIMKSAGKKLSGIKRLSTRDIVSIMEHEPYSGSSISQWFSDLSASDTRRIASAVKFGYVNSETISQITSRIMASIDSTRSSARTLTRTVGMGVSNESMRRIYEKNMDVLDGLKWTAAMDSRLCIACGALDGTIYKDGQPYPRPPIHPNCRCVIIPWIEVGDIPDNIDAGRPVEAMPFDAMAKERHDSDTSSRKKWDDLSWNTRNKLRYEEIRKWEKKTGKSGYRSEKQEMNFSDIFKKQPVSFQKEWLGMKRFEAYKKGSLRISDLINPHTGFIRTIKELGL